MHTPDYRLSVTHALRDALVPDGASSAELLRACLAGWPAGQGAVWYPSAGSDYRDLMELALPRRAENGLQIATHLFVHTSIDPWRGATWSAAFSDRNTQVRTLRSASFTLAKDAARTVGLRDAHFLRADDNGPRHARLFEVEVTSSVVGELRAWLLDLSVTNYDFFVRFVLERGLRFSTYIQARQGLGMGGCGLGTVYLTPWLAWAGCREMICDGEFHGSAEQRDRVFAAFRAAGAPLDPPSFDVEHRGRALRWSGYPADAATLTPRPAIEPLARALAVARSRLTHPRSIWSTSRDNLDNPATFNATGDNRPMFQLFPLLHASLPLIEVDGQTFLLDTGATHSMGAAAVTRSLLGRCLTTPAAPPIVQMVWPAVRNAVQHLGYDGPLDALVGVDRLAALDLIVDAPNGFIALRPAARGDGASDSDDTRLASTLRHDLPCVRLQFGDKEWLAALDTGATLGYFVGAPPADAVAGPLHVDHHPLVGQFTAPTFRDNLSLRCADGTALSLGEHPIGRIDGMLEASLRMAGLDAAIGGAIFTKHAVRLTEKLGRVDVLGATVHDTLGRHYEAMFDDLYGPAILSRHGAGLAEAAAARGARRVLDVGAGAGTVSRSLRARGVSVVAVEPSRGLAGVLAGELARGENPVEVYLGKAEDLSTLAIAPVDMTFFAFGVVDYLLDDDALRRALAGAYALTRAGGHCWVQPAPSAFFQSADPSGTRYRREVRVATEQDGGVVQCDHRVFLDGTLVSRDQLRLRPRTPEQVRAVAEEVGWTYAGVDVSGLYPTVRLTRAA